MKVILDDVDQVASKINRESEQRREDRFLHHLNPFHRPDLRLHLLLLAVARSQLASSIAQKKSHVYSSLAAPPQ
jgi:hypothetical protein